jgi:hypothetical protein
MAPKHPDAGAPKGTEVNVDSTGRNMGSPGYETRIVTTQAQADARLAETLMTEGGEPHPLLTGAVKSPPPQEASPVPDNLVYSERDHQWLLAAPGGIHANGHITGVVVGENPATPPVGIETASQDNVPTYEQHDAGVPDGSVPQ